MPKTSKITFNVNDLQREHTGQKRRYDNVGLARLINSPLLQERVKKLFNRVLWSLDTQKVWYAAARGRNRQ